MQSASPCAPVLCYCLPLVKGYNEPLTELHCCVYVWMVGMKSVGGAWFCVYMFNFSMSRYGIGMERSRMDGSSLGM